MESFKLPREIIEKFLKSFIPEAIELVSLMRPLKCGDSFSPQLRQALVNLNIQGWAPLYQDPQNAVKIKLLSVMSPEEIKALNDELKNEPIEKQLEWAVEFIEAAIELGWEEPSEEEAEKSFDEMNEDEKEKFIRDLRLMVGCWIPSLLNSLAIMVHRKSLFQLVGEAAKGDDESFLKAIQIDKTTLTTIPYFIERNRRAADKGDFNFQRQINTYRNKPIFVGRPRYPALWLVFATLEEAHLLDEYEQDKDALLDLCEELGVYGSKYGVEDVQSFARRLREYKRDQNPLLLRTPLPEDVKDATSSN